MEREPFIPFAVWYTGGKARATMVRPPEPDSPIAWKKDLQAIRDCGFNTVRCWTDWATSEPRPGEYHFETLDLLMDLAEEVGLKVIDQIYMDSAPDWLVKYFPDCRYVSAGGTPIDSQGAPGYCYDNPGVHEAATQWMIKVAERVAKRPNFLGWDLWSEPHIVQWGYFDFLPQPSTFCYCSHTVQRFRDWLKKKYVDLDALNKAWYRQFSSWDLIPAPRFISLMSYTEYIDWILFIQDKLAEDLLWRHESVRVADQHITTSHSATPDILTLPLDEQGSPDDWRMAHSVEIWGTSLYPKHMGFRETNDASFRAALLSSTRSACNSNNAGYWLGELQAGHGYMGMTAAHMNATDARMYTLQPLAHGAKGLCFYSWHPMNCGYESAGFGMANLDGTPSDRALAAGSLSRSVGQDMELFARGKVSPAEVAICWNLYSNIMWQCMRETRHYIPSRGYVGAYRAMYQSRLPADFIHADQISAGKLDDYKILYLPFSFMLPKASAKQIEAFVNKGGVVLAEARTAWNDEAGYCGEAVPGFGLSQVFGCREKGAQTVDEGVQVKIRIVKEHKAIPLLKKDDVVIGAYFRELMELLSSTAEVLGVFEDGSPAIVVNPYGKGVAMFVGTLLSVAFYHYGDPNAGKLLKGLPLLASLTPPVTVAGVDTAQDIEPRLLQGKTSAGVPYTIFFGFNHTSQSLHPRFGLALPEGEYAVTDVVTRQAVQYSWEDNRLMLDKELAQGEIWVMKLLPVGSN